MCWADLIGAYDCLAVSGSKVASTDNEWSGALKSHFIMTFPRAELEQSSASEIAFRLVFVVRSAIGRTSKSSCLERRRWVETRRRVDRKIASRPAVGCRGPPGNARDQLRGESCEEALYFADTRKSSRRPRLLCDWRRRTGRRDELVGRVESAECDCSSGRRPTCRRERTDEETHERETATANRRKRNESSNSSASACRRRRLERRRELLQREMLQQRRRRFGIGSRRPNVSRKWAHVATAQRSDLHLPNRRVIGLECRRLQVHLNTWAADEY